MRKAWIWTAVLVLAANGPVCRADEESNETPDKPAAVIPAADQDAKDAPAANDEVVPAGATEEPKKGEAKVATIPADAPKDHTAACKDYVVTIDCKHARRDKPPLPPSPGWVIQAHSNCYCGRGKECVRGCAEKIWNWFTYRPLSRPGLAGCCQKCCDCHVPPLYTYFLDNCHAAGCCNGTNGAAPGCQNCAHP
jgi:hypothetical protein